MTVIDTIKSVFGADPTERADADMRRVLNTLKRLNPKPIEHLDATQARRQPSAADAVKKMLEQMGVDAKAPSGVRSRDITIDGAAGWNLARVFTPTTSTVPGREAEPLPLILYFHGGGFVIADLDTYDAAPRAIAAQTGAIVLSAHYRQAPEHKFPAAHDDAIAAWRWTLANAARLGADPSRLAVMGESAGANLAANVTIYARDHGLQMPVSQGLVYPITDTNTHTLSYEENRQAQPLNKPMMLWFVEQSLADPADKADKRLKLVEQDLRNLPPTFLITAGIDPLRSDGEKFGKALKDAGNWVESRNYAGVTHEFFGMGAVVQAAREAQGFLAAGMRAAFGPSTPTRSGLGSRAGASEAPKEAGVTAGPDVSTIANATLTAQEAATARAATPAASETAAANTVISRAGPDAPLVAGRPGTETLAAGPSVSVNRFESAAGLSAGRSVADAPLSDAVSGRPDVTR